MKAVRLLRVGSAQEALAIEDVPLPAPKTGEVLIKLAAASVNFADVGRRTGIYPVQEFPSMLGLEGAGYVATLGPGVTAFKVGDRVMASPVPYSYAEYTVARVEAVFAVPGTLTLEEAASIPVVFATAWHCLVSAAKAKAGESVLVHAAGSGCGVAAIQIAKHLGLRVLATAGTDAKLEKAKALGADEGINYRTSTFKEETLRLTGGEGVDIVLDGIGGETLVSSLECMRPLGRLVTYGKAGGNRKVELDPFVLWVKHLSIIGMALFGYPRSASEELFALFQTGRLRPVIDRTYPLEQAAEAHRYVEERQVFGKVVLTMN
jgi:NADPH:quinone reductase